METRDTTVAVHQVSDPMYPVQCPYDPSEAFPEYRGQSVTLCNSVYTGVRELLNNLELDSANFGTAQWNPLGSFIKPWMTVFIKPNTVTHYHPRNKDLFSVITHASVVRPILDYVCLALQDHGTIIVADCPLYCSDFNKAFERSGIAPLLRWYSLKTSVKIEWFDLRINKARRTWAYGRWARSKILQDPRGYRFVDLAKNSRFAGIDPSRLRIAVAGYVEMRNHHTEEKHEYLFPQSLLDSDVIISLPKLKTHRRTGVTLCLKNYMGIPSMKACLPHFMTGSPSEGGDQYIHRSGLKRICTRLHDKIQTSPHVPVKFACAVLKKLLWMAGRLLIFKDSVSEAMWPGNDTLWRTLGDINEIITYADKQGVFAQKPQRTQLFIVDGIVGGGGNGPLEPDPVYSGTLIGGFNAVATDIVAASLMGFDYAKIPLIYKLISTQKPGRALFDSLVTDIIITGLGIITDLEQFRHKHHLRFAPHPAWRGAIEYEQKI